MLLTLLLVPVAFATSIAVLKGFGVNIGRKAAGGLATVVLALSFFQVVYISTLMTGRMTEFYPWLNMLNLSFNLILDDLSLLFAAAIAGFSALASAYSIIYLKAHKHPLGEELYFANLLLFEVGMLGVVLSENIIQFLLFFEAMNIPAFFLAYFWGDKGGKEAAMKYILYMAVGASLLIGGITYLVGSTGETSLFELPARIAEVGLNGDLLVAGALFAGFAIKIAAVPFHTWLPDFHGEAPTPVSALLSAVMIKLGAYGWVRIVFPFFPSVIEGSSGFLAVLALLTIGWGGYMALSEPDFKRLLVYSSISQVGYILFGLATLTSIGVSGGLLHVFTHGSAKFLLLLVAGSFIYSVHRRKISELGGLAGKLPATATLALVGALSISGAPPFGGFQSEWRVFVGGMERASSLALYGTEWAFWTVMTWIGVLLTALTAAYYMWTVMKILYGKMRPAFVDASESPSLMLVSMGVAGFIALLFGFAPGIITAYTDRFAQLMVIIFSG